jgi:predicted nucleic acid-binding protein
LLQGGVELRPLDRGRFRHAAELLQDPALGLRAGDALHLAVALHSRCTQLASFDIRMQQAATVLGLSPAPP